MEGRGAYTIFAGLLVLENVAIEKKSKATPSPEMYLRFRGVSLRYFACVSLNSTVPRRQVYVIRAEMRGRRRKWRFKEMCTAK